MINIDYLKNKLRKVKYELLFNQEIKKTENFIREKRISSDKIKIVFIIHMPDTWTSFKSIYEEALLDETKYSVYILAQPHITNSQGLQFQNPAFDYLSSKYKNVINAYTDEWYDLRKLNPDYVFYTRPYNYLYYDLYKSFVVREYAKVCFVEYGYTMQLKYTSDTIYNKAFFKDVSILFCTNASSVKFLSRKFKISSNSVRKCCYLGYPRFDLIDKSEGKTIKTILWTPRWTCDKKGQLMSSTFLLYKDLFLTFAEQNKSLKLIIRPHPLMFQNYMTQGVMTLEEARQFKEICKNSTNVYLDEYSDYSLSMSEADLFISDFSSLVMEFFITGKPIIYCDNNIGFIEEANLMYDVLYKAKSWIDIEANIKNIIEKGDCLYTNREEIISKIQIDKKSCKRFLDFISDDARSNNG